MRTTLASAALALSFGGVAPALAVVALTGAVHVARSPDHLLDAAYVFAMLGMGYLAG